MNVARARKAFVGEGNPPAPKVPEKKFPGAVPKKPLPKAPAHVQTSGKRGKKNPYFHPTDAKPAQATATVSHFTDPLLKNLVGEDERGDAARVRASLQMMRESCAFFASEVLSGPPQAPYNGRFFVAEHHEEWNKLVREEKRLCVLSARDHGKTFFFSFAFPIWKAVFTPNGKGYIFSATAPQAARILEDIKTEIESNPKLQWLLPKGKRTRGWTSTSITLANGHKIYARGYGTKVRGAHPDWIVVDDGLNDEDAYSEIVRQKNVDYFYTAITNMIVPGGIIIVVGTPFHASDLYGDLAKNPRYTFRKFPALNRLTGKALWPMRYCATKVERLRLEMRGVIVESLEERRIEIASIRFAREFECEPISDEMSLFPEYLFRGQDVETMETLGRGHLYWASLGIVRRFIGFDFAISSTTRADYTAAFVIGLDSRGNRWILDIQQHRGLGYEEQLSLINALGRKYRPELIYLEANQMQRIFGDVLIEKTDLPIAKFYTTGVGTSARARRKKVPSHNTASQNKNSLAGGVPMLRVLLENRKYRIPRGDALSVEMTERWVQEMKAFTWIENKLQGVGSHDDLCMACWITERAIQDSGGADIMVGDEDGPVDVDALLREQMGVDSEGKPLSDAYVSASEEAELARLIGKKPETTVLENVPESTLDDPVFKIMMRFGERVESGGRAHLVDKAANELRGKLGLNNPPSGTSTGPATLKEATGPTLHGGEADDEGPDEDDDSLDDLGINPARRAWQNLPGLGR